MADLVEWKAAGSYFEACNCIAICPCRRQGGVKGGTRSTYGVCDFALSWWIKTGSAGAVKLDGLKVVIAGGYNDDEAGRPWRCTLYIDEAANADQAAALESIFKGNWGGTAHRQMAKNIIEFYGVRRAKIELDHQPKKWFIRAADYVEVRATKAVDSEKPVTCGIPGHDRSGVEVVADLMRVDDAPLKFEVFARCGYASDFDYKSGDA